MFADIIIPLAVTGVYTYSIPAHLLEDIEEGVLVIVSFGKNKKYTGIVIRVHENQPQEYEVRAIEEIGDTHVRLSGQHLKFLLWMSEYYMCAPGEVVRAALPVTFRLESHTSVLLTNKIIDFSLLTANEERLVRFLYSGEEITLREVEKMLEVKSGAPILRSLLQKGYIEVKETVDERFRDKKEKIVKAYRNFSESEQIVLLDRLKRAPQQYAMFCRWLEYGGLEIRQKELLDISGGTAAILKVLCEKNILAVEERVVSRLEEEEENVSSTYPLSEVQQEVLVQIKKGFESKSCVLFQGVTSSGKTEVYIHLIQEYIAQGKQVLYMLPEIALTVQIIRRLKRVFGNTVGVYHSGMPDIMRAELWRRQCSDNPYRLILGVRSSLFLPFSDLGLVIIDEEHDPSYKQQEPAPRYNGRDAAIMAAHIYGAKVLLGSATPALESYINAKTGKYGYVTLEKRFGDIVMPKLLLADVAEYRRKKIMKGSFSPLLYEEIKNVLKEKKQVILFQNRKGYSTYLQCDKCGEILKCRHCDVSMTFYKGRDVVSCRYCGSIRKAFQQCESCREGHYKFCTPGTEKIEEEVKALFPGVRVGRMDAETMNSRAKYNKLIKDFEEGSTDLLIGTQMVAKGLDFDGVKLVGVMDADSILNYPDFRSEERAYSMLMQVSGRSGRRSEQGRVVIQTSEKNSRVYHYLLEGGYEQLFNELAEEREIFGYPPYCRLIRIELKHSNIVIVRNAANVLARRLREKMGKRVVGPSEPEVSRVKRQNRIHLLLKIEAGASLYQIKKRVKEEIGLLLGEKGNSSLKIICDVDV